MIKSLSIVLAFLAIFVLCFTNSEAYDEAYDIGVYYYPGWATYIPWRYAWKYGWQYIKPFPEREPLIGWYPEEEQRITDKHLEWAYNYGITFFVYDWYWDGKQAAVDHAINNYLKSKWKEKVKFAILWANNYRDIPKNKKEFEEMVNFWIENYFKEPSYYTIDNKPVVFIFSNYQINLNAKKFGMDVGTLLKLASKRCMDKIGKGIYFVATINAKPSDGLELSLKNFGYSAYTGWNYVTSEDKNKIADYASMVKTYKNYYDATASTKKHLKYIVPVSPGWDDRPLKDQEAIVRTDPTPEKFKEMLVDAKKYLDKQDGARILMIEAWNEFGEGAYIEPTKKWGFKYLETVRDVFRKK